MTPASARENAAALSGRYPKVAQAEKGQILAEFCLTTGYHRKPATRLLVRSQSSPVKSAGRQVQYGTAVVQALRQVWEASDYLCSKRLQPFVETLVDQVLHPRQVEQ